MAMNNVTCIEDLRILHRKRVPRAFFEYVDGGAYSEATLRANRDDLERLGLRQRVMVDVSGIDLRTTILGTSFALPFGLAPIGLAGLQYPDGEIHACRAAIKAQIPFALSTASICSIEDVAREAGSPFWFQLYAYKDTGFVRALIERAAAANCSALIVTVDVPVFGQRHRDLKNGMSVPPRLTLRNAYDTLKRPGWLLGMMRTKRANLGNLAGHVEGKDNLASLGAWAATQLNPSLSWKDVDWIRGLWKGPIVIKGIMAPADAREAVRSGAQGIVVSNHGGRQLDGAPSSISALPAIVQEAGSEAEILFDGGVRSGQDVMRVLALGAKGCLIGRAYIHGLGAGGEAGVAKAIDIIARELATTMALCGVRTIAEIGPQVII